MGFIAVTTTCCLTFYLSATSEFRYSGSTFYRLWTFRTTTPKCRPNFKFFRERLSPKLVLGATSLKSKEIGSVISSTKLSSFPNRSSWQSNSNLVSKVKSFSSKFLIKTKLCSTFSASSSSLFAMTHLRKPTSGNTLKDIVKLLL